MSRSWERGKGQGYREAVWFARRSSERSLRACWRFGSRTGGERGIRTLDRVSPIHAFQACAFNHSAISPGCRGTVLRRQKRPRQFSLTRARLHAPPACYHGRTMLLEGLDRRDWMRLVAVLAAASASEAQSPQGQTQAAPPARVNKEMLHGALQLI